jgi:hypothetical protein
MERGLKPNMPHWDIVVYPFAGREFVIRRDVMNIPPGVNPKATGMVKEENPWLGEHWNSSQSEDHGNRNLVVEAKL